MPTAFDEPAGLGRSNRRAGWAFVPDPLPPARLEEARGGVVDRLWPLLELAMSGLVRLETSVEGLSNPRILLGALRMREAQASSRIENTVASIQDVAMAGVGAGPVSPQALEVNRNRLAIEEGLESALPVSGRLVRRMHEVLVTEPRHRPGRYREGQVYIGDEATGFEGARFVPPPGAEVERCMADWERFVNGEALGATGRRWPALIELGLAHYQFEAIHPFSDGNGRLGRALVNLGPLKAGWLKHPVCNLSEWVQARRQEYYDRLLRVSTDGEWEAWLEFFVRAVGEQAELDLARAGRLSALLDRYRRELATKRSSALAWRLIEHLFETQVVTIPGAARVMGVTYPAAKRHVGALVDRGVLVGVSEGNYGKIFLAFEILRAIRGRDAE